MSTSIQDVARAANVSISTVSRSFTRPELVSKATREKVLRIAEELNFSTSRSAVALKTGRALRVALLVSDHIRLWFSASVIEGLNQVLHEEGYDISIFQISSIEERKEFFEMLPVRRNADAVIVVSFDIDNTEIAQLNSAAVPIVGINSVLPQERGFSASINIDDVQGSILAARHLISLGHRDIAYVRTDRDVSLHFSVQQRFDARGTGMSTSIQDVARAANVSISTVSRSYTRPELVSKAKREKVLRIAEELNFSTSRSAVALKTGRA